MADKNKMHEYYSKPAQLGKWEGFKQFLWNSETSECLGRTGGSWGKCHRTHDDIEKRWKFFGKSFWNCYVTWRKWKKTWRILLHLKWWRKNRLEKFFTWSERQTKNNSVIIVYISIRHSSGQPFLMSFQSPNSCAMTRRRRRIFLP